MKNTVKGLMVMALIVLALPFAKANEDTYFNLLVREDYKLEISVKNVWGETSISIYDEEEALVFTTPVRHSGSVEQVLDFSFLSRGDYTIVFRDELKVQSAAFRVEDAIGLLTRVTTRFVPRVTVHDKSVIVSVSSLDSDKMTVCIYDADGNRLNREVVSGQNYIGARYDFSEVFTGNYLVEVQFGNETYTHEVRID